MRRVYAWCAYTGRENSPRCFLLSSGGAGANSLRRVAWSISSLGVRLGEEDGVWSDGVVRSRRCQAVRVAVPLVSVAGSSLDLDVCFVVVLDGAG